MRELWIRDLEAPDWEERLFELEMTLKALDRFFNLHNLPLNAADTVIQRDFSIEMRVVSAACRQVALIARYLLKEDSSAFTFQSYVERRMLSDHVRDAQITDHLAQADPSESLFLLGESFQNLADVTEALTRLNAVSYPVFFSTGQMVSRTIAANRFFNPMAGDHFHPAHDRMRSSAVNAVVKKIAEKELRREVSITLLAMFRLLRYLSFVDDEAENVDELRYAGLIFALVNSEARMLIHHMEKEAPEELAVLRHSGSEEAAVFLDTIDSLAFQCGMELRKVFHQILRDLISSSSVSKLRAVVSSAAGVLRNFFEQAIVVVVQTFEPTVQGRTIFPDFVSKLEQSLRLREDLWVLNKVCDATEQALTRENLTKSQVLEALRPLTDFTDYFTNLSFACIRYADHDEFERFFTMVQTTGSDVASTPKRLDDFRRKIDYFNRFVETTLGHVRHRQELRDIPLDSENAERLLDQFLG